MQYFFGVVASEGEGWMEVRLALPWFPEEPAQTWIIPGTYQTWETADDAT